MNLERLLRFTRLKGLLFFGRLQWRLWVPALAVLLLTHSCARMMLQVQLPADPEAARRLLQVMLLMALNFVAFSTMWIVGSSLGAFLLMQDLHRRYHYFWLTLPVTRLEYFLSAVLLLVSRVFLWALLFGAYLLYLRNSIPLSITGILLATVMLLGYGLLLGALSLCVSVVGGPWVGMVTALAYPALWSYLSVRATQQESWKALLYLFPSPRIFLPWLSLASEAALDSGLQYPWYWALLSVFSLSGLFLLFGWLLFSRRSLRL